ncbi:MAG TPA: ribose 5-phosphate isomerase A [Solirubrobacteraceae bacterium]
MGIEAQEPTGIEAEKRAVARAAAALVEDGMRVGLGTGSTVAYLLPALAERDLTLRCVATSVATALLARKVGLPIEPFDALDALDIAIDGADQVAPSGWVMKGGGGAHTREKIVALAATRFVVIVSSDKLVSALGPPVPLELLSFGLPATLRALRDARVRADAPLSPDGGVIADHYAPFEDPTRLAADLKAIPGVIEHGLFPAAMVSDVLIARGETVEHRRVS